MLPTSLSVLSRLDLKHLRPGENDKEFVFTGPGVVLIACEKDSQPGEIRFSLLNAVSADDAFAAATSLLKQSHECDGYVFAMLARVEKQTDRDAVLQVL